MATGIGQRCLTLVRVIVHHRSEFRFWNSASRHGSEHFYNFTELDTGGQGYPDRNGFVFNLRELRVLRGKLKNC